MDFRAVFAGLAFSLMWSSAFTSARLVVADAPPLFALSARFCVSGLLAVGIAAALRQSWKMSRKQWGAVILFGLFQNAIYLGLNFVAIQWVEASVAVIVASLLPLLVALASWLIYRERLPLLGSAGLALGFAGVAVIMGGRLSAGVDPFGLLLMFLGALALTVATLLVRDALPRGNLLMIVGLQMLAGSAALLPAALVHDTWHLHWSLSLVLAFTYTTLVPGIGATVVWFWLVRRIGATRAATYHFMNPFFGVAVAALVLGERLGARDVLGVAVVGAGILAVQLSRRPA
ncbi:DMT family transporter [Paroceanicella profunda]|uniref:DMT family transporter n=1 Tax=Paroceanicella profunda TaxID=2579971 RepID=A0A5B8FYQ0_9RHOB|nr:DMT family transporter [Paroceanicella profunda]QDL93645.1 DMT family transporter [Paroceanicella profunda]